MEIVELPVNALKCPKNLRCLCIGASESGKSTWIASLIKNKEKVFQSPGYSKFLFCSPNIKSDPTSTAGRDLRYKEFLEEQAQPADIVFFDRIITEEELLAEADSTPGKSLLIFDDFSQEVFNNDLTYQLFTRLSSHGRIDSCISLHQGVKSSKSPGKWYSLIFNNANFLVFFRNIANRAAIGRISSDIFPYGQNHLQRCLDEATDICGMHAYICINANLQNPLNPKFGVRTNIFEENDNPVLLFKNPKRYDKKRWINIDKQSQSEVVALFISIHKM